MRIFKKNDTEEDDGSVSEIPALKELVLKSRMPEAVEKAALKEIGRLSKNSPSSAEYTIGVNYIDYLVSLPWNRMTDDCLDIARAGEILDDAHYGLTGIKDRILEYLAVRILKLSRKHKILVVDDEKMTRMNLEHVLSKEGYEVATAENGEEALELLNDAPFDLIITDLKMDKIDGMGVLEQARARIPGIAVIIITGYATVPTAIEAMKRGSFHFLAKPLRLNEVRQVVENALAPKKSYLTAKGPALCFAGPPGTGKTSLGRSIARSLGRTFVRFSLAGTKDEAEIRGHRRSYVGALPGRIIQEIRRAECKNPVFMLDELDKIGQDFKGDAASALLEVLDPEQNSRFMDHYLDAPFDLSNVMFIATANAVDLIPGPLLDRLEVITLSGYSDMEKEKIAFRYLIPRELEEAGLSDSPPTFTPEGVRKIIRDYTREAGLRNLQRNIASVCRKIARERLNAPAGPATMHIEPETVEHFLGARKYHVELADAAEKPGMAVGLAWTETGGEIMFVEATCMKGGNKLILTGSLGNVMKESAQAALSYIRSNTTLFGIPEDFFTATDIHIHVPAGAIPKDGPSAGVTIAVALISLLTDRPCRTDAAMTGELTLSGRILPVGGVREKILAAHRAGISQVAFPAKNAPDLRDIPEDIRNEVAVVTVDDIAQVLDMALRKAP